MNNLIKDLANLTNEMNRKNITSGIYKETYNDKLDQIIGNFEDNFSPFV